MKQRDSIDHTFDADFANDLARLESYNKHLYRPNTYLHKWWARRCGSTFRLILKHLVEDPSRQDYYSAGGLEGKIVLDPMMGGGTTLHEAIRMGANVIGADIDPIPLLQARATLSEVDASELEADFLQLLRSLQKKLAKYYRCSCPYCGEETEQRHVLHGVRRSCHCGEAIFVDSLILRHNSDGSSVRLDPDMRDIYWGERQVAKAPGNHKLPIFSKSQGWCDACGQRYGDDLTRPYYRRYVPLAIFGLCEAERLLFFAPPTQKELKMIQQADDERARLDFDPADFAVQQGPKSRSLIDRGVGSYLDLFSSRQLLFLNESVALLSGYDRLPRLILSMLVSTSLEFNSMLCGYKGAHRYRPGAIRHAFAHHAYAFPYTALENNPIYPKLASGSLLNLFHTRIQRGRKWAKEPVERRIREEQTEKVSIKGETDWGTEYKAFNDLLHGEKRFLLIHGSSASLDLPDASVDYVVTDPPYFDSVQYSDLAAFFRVWLRRFVPEEVTWEVPFPLTQSAVEQHRNGNGQYTTVLSEILRECRRVLKTEGRLIFTFHHWKAKGWSALTKALRSAGFVLVNRHVVHAENRASVHIVNQRALLHDVILVLAPRGSGPELQWQLPVELNKRDGEAFCLECGTVVGWILNNDLAETDIEATWQTLLD